MKIIAVPRNGFGNRMQMLASSTLLAKRLDAELIVHWTPQPVFKAQSGQIFDEVPGVRFVDYPDLESSYPFEMPTFTNFDSENNRITLKNLRVGDQAFMPSLKRILQTHSEISEIWIESGEKFLFEQDRNFQDSPEFRRLRMNFYNQVKFQKSILHNLNSLLSQVGEEFWAVHIRDNDRKSETIHNAKIVKEIQKNKSKVEKIGKTVFLASDNARRGVELKALLEKEGYDVFFDEAKNRDRLNPDEAQESIVDWLALRNAKCIVSFGGTTFSYEALVAGNSFDSRIYLKPSKGRRALSKIHKEALLFRLYGKIPFIQFILRK
jgi:hypothetical protein